jgi:hypothetical protein
MSKMNIDTLKMRGMDLPAGRWIFLDEEVRKGIQQAWQDSSPGISGGHEEGGFVLLDETNHLSILRWPKGSQNEIAVPDFRDCKIDGKDIIATFHTHPNTGHNYLQEPSETDKRAVRDDPELKGENYEGEFVISLEKLYLIMQNGNVVEVGETQDILGV